MLSWLKITVGCAGFLLLFSLTACDGGSSAEKRMNFELNGTLKNGPGLYVTLSEITADGLILLDSAKANESGDFSLSASLQEDIFCLLQVGNIGNIKLVAEKGKETSVYADVEDLSKYSIRNSDASRQLKIFLDLNAREQSKMDTLRKRYGNLDPNNLSEEEFERINAEIRRVRHEHQEMLENFVKVNEGTIATYYPIGFMLQEPSPEILTLAYQKLNKLNPQSKYTLYLKEGINALSSTLPGAEAPPLVLPDLRDSLFALSRLRGKIVLVDFWASWCKPCRKSNPELVALYNRFKSNRFEILGVSLDEDTAAWKAAIKEDGLRWKQVNDRNSMSSAVARAYHVKTIPASFLLDSTGRVIIRNPDIAELARILEERLGAD